MKTHRARFFTLSFSRLLLAPALAALLPASAALVRAQSVESPERGFHPSGSYALSKLEAISMSGGNLSMQIPVGGLPSGRGGLSAGLSLIYNSKVWDIFHSTEPPPECPPGGSCDPEPPRPIETLGRSQEGGWRYGFQYELQLFQRDYSPPFDQHNYNVCQDLLAVYYYQLRMSFPDGSVRGFALQGQQSYDGYYAYTPGGATGWSQCAIPSPQTGTMTYYSTDGTYLRLDVQHDADNNWSNNPWTLYFPDGRRVTGGNAPQRIYDRNNNYVEVQNVTNYNGTGHTATRLVDQLGRALVIEYGTATNQDSIHARGFAGEDLTWTVKWKGITVNKTYFNGDRLRNVGITLKVIEQVVLPSQSGGLSYTFGYNAGTANPSAGWGELSSITLPTGASAAYQYELDGVSGTIAPYEILRNSPKRKDLTYLREYDGTSTPVTETWLYSIDQETQIGQITAPDGGVSREIFAPFASGQIGGVPNKSEHPDGTVVERQWLVNTPYGFSNLSQGSLGDNTYVRTEYTSVRNAAGALSKTAIKTYKQDKNGNVTEIKEYDWVDYASVHDAGGNPTWSVTGATLKRTVVNAYHSPTPDASDSTTDDPDSYHKPTSPRLRNAVASTEVKSGASTVASRAEFTYDNATTTGNLTSQKSWDSARGAYSNPLSAANSVAVTHQYDVYGNRTLTTDPRGFQAKQVYGAVGGHTGLYPTESYAAYGTTVQRKTTRVFNFDTGLVMTSTDVDNNVSITTDFNAFGRPTLVTSAAGKPEEARTATEYSDAARRVIVRQDLTTAGDGKLVSVRHFNQLGRVRLSRQLENSATESATDETDGIKVQSRYAFSGSNNYKLVSNPYRAATSGAAGTEATMGWTRMKSDSGGRVVEVRSYSGGGLPAPLGANATTTGAVTTLYDGVNTTVTDQASKDRQSTIDALGQLTQIIEDPGTNGFGYVTTHAYDALGNLKTVTQAGPQNGVQVTQTRTFTYDSLSRLQTAVNPESGTISYDYDDNGNLTKKVDPRLVPGAATKVETAYTYDALNRPVAKSYNDSTPDVAYFYDAQALPAGAPTFVRGSSEGRLVAVLTGGTNAGTYYGYDALGQVLRRIQRTDSVNYLSEATYDRAGSVLTETYPVVPGATGRRTVTYSFDGAGRLSALDTDPTTYAAGAGVTAVSYTAHGALDKETLGNGLVHDLTYNARLQPTQIKLGTAAAPTSALSLTYSYGTSANNGNVLEATNKVGSWTAKQIYTYDGVNRLDATAETNGSTVTHWTEANGYDRFGNRWEVNAGAPSVTFNNKNRVVGYAYDAAGNVTNDTVHTYEYDAENRIKAVHGEANVYTYDGEGSRVRIYFSLGQQLRLVYGVGGKLIAEFDPATGALEKEYIYGRTGVVATIEPVAGTKYTTSDHLGSPRVVTADTGAVLSRHDFRPFGQELAVGDGNRTAAPLFGVNDGLRQKFTGKERDNETGLDYFGARYYSASMGRFTSVDPLAASANVSDPQSWNRYTYANNNPLKYVDPEGLKKEPVFQAYEDIYDDQRRILENSSITVGKGDNKQTLSGQALYDHLAKNDPKALANFLNQTSVLMNFQVMMKDGAGHPGFTTGAALVNSVTSISQDRIIANVDPMLKDAVEIASIAPQGFNGLYSGPESSGGEHGDFDVSFRQRMDSGPQQLSFNTRNGFRSADIDIDYYLNRGGGGRAKHIFLEGLPNTVFKTRTDPYKVFEIIQQNPKIGIKPNYRLEKR